MWLQREAVKTVISDTYLILSKRGFFFFFSLLKAFVPSVCFFFFFLFTPVNAFKTILEKLSFSKYP